MAKKKVSKEERSKKAIADLLNRMDDRYLALDSAERALFHLLKKYQDDLPQLDDYFQKAFRQCDCVDVENGGGMDIAIHNLLDVAPMFWRLFEKYRIDTRVNQKVSSGRKLASQLGKNPSAVNSREYFNTFTCELHDMLMDDREVIVVLRCGKRVKLGYTTNEEGGCFVGELDNVDLWWYNDGLSSRDTTYDIMELAPDGKLTVTSKKVSKSVRPRRTKR